MDVTPLTWVVAVAGLALIVLLSALQLVAVLRPKARWTVDNVYGGSPDDTDPTAYFAYNQGYAWADPFSGRPCKSPAAPGCSSGNDGASFSR
jgi:hypothetical protein